MMRDILVALSNSNGTKTSIQSLLILISRDLTMSTPFLADSCQFDASVHRCLFRGIDRAFGAEEVVPKWPVNWQSSREHADTNLDGRKLSRVDVSP